LSIKQTKKQKKKHTTKQNENLKNNKTKCNKETLLYQTKSQLTVKEASRKSHILKGEENKL
jgi:hypothetical protein